MQEACQFLQLRSNPPKKYIKTVQQSLISAPIGTQIVFQIIRPSESRHIKRLPHLTFSVKSVGAALQL